MFGNIPFLRTFFNGAIGIIVVWIIGTTLTICVALEFSSLLCILYHAGTELQQHGFSFTHDSNRRRSQVQTYLTRSNCIFLLSIGNALLNQLHIKTIFTVDYTANNRSEERRVGKECRSRW